MRNRCIPSPDRLKEVWPLHEPSSRLLLPLRFVVSCRFQKGMTMTPRLFAIVAVCLVSAGAVRADNAGEDGKLEFFEKKVRPVLAANCYNCHSANTKALSGLRVDDRNGLLTGGKRGPAIVPGDPAKSRLILAVKHDLPKASMPPEKTLSDEEIADLARWIKDGAAWPRVALPSSIGRYAEKYKALRKEHWAYQPLRDPKSPAVKDAAWATDDVDRFVLAGLEKKGLHPVGDASRFDLIRRVTFDLGGRGVRRRPVAQRVREGRRSAARLEGIRRTLGPALARRRPLRRVDRLRPQSSLSARLALPRLGDRCGGEGSPLRPVHPPADRR
jgi:mono/diheme cytochrome c family protein